MSTTLTIVPTRVVVSTQNRLALVRRNELGQATSEYGVAILVAIALAMAVLEIFTHGILNPILSTLLKKALSTATGMIH